MSKNALRQKPKIWLQSGLIALAVLFSTALSAQITGTVTDAKTGETLIGASVLLKNTSTGTTTDIDGTFSIDASVGDEIEISYTGYTTQTVVVGVSKVIMIALDEGVTIDEVVVTGYTTQRKRDITGAVAVVDTEELESIAASSVTQKLEGRATGITLSSSGAPGEATNLRIRGISSFGNNNPLWVIDGVPTTDNFNTGLNPNDIESIQVLKDASAASIYGSRAANGVVVVTTKKGKAGNVKVSYNGYVGMQNPVGDYGLINTSEEYLQSELSTFERAGLDLPGYIENGQLTEYSFPAGNTADESTYSYPDNLIMKTNKTGTDWWDEVFNPASVMDHNLSISGGSENSTFMISAGYFNQEGTMIHTDFNRYSLRANSSFKVKRFRFGENLQIRTGERRRVNASVEQSIIGNIFKISPITPIYDVSGVNFAGSKANGLPQGSNPVAALFNGKDNVQEYFGLFGNFYGEFHFTDYLYYKSSIGLDFSNNFAPNFTFPTFEDREPRTSNSFFEQWDRWRSWTWTNTLHFDMDLDEKINLKALAGYEAIQGKYRGVNGGIADYFITGTDVRYLNAVLGNAGSRSVSSFGSENTLVSMFGKVDFSYDDKYILGLTVRRDGSSRFSEDNRYAVFPAFSFGWRLSQEAFMQDLTWLDELKIRGGWGLTGNQQIRDYNYVDNFGSNGIGNTGYAIAGGNTPATGFALIRRGNADTKWEASESINIGFDAGFAQGKFNLVFDWWTREINDLLYDPALPGTSGSAAAPFVNVAGMKNTGIDIGINYRDRFSSDLTFEVGLNLSHYKNEITEIDGEREFFLVSAIGTRDPITPSINQIGSPISAFRGFTVEGIFQNQAEVDASGQEGAKIGGLKFADLDGDGMITEEGDVGIIGSPHPDLTAGLNLTLGYKNFDFTAFFLGVFGNEISNQTRAFTHLRQFNSTVTKDVLANAWTESNTGTDIPALNADDPSSKQQSTYYIEDGTYVRLKQLQLGYTLPLNTIERVGISKLRFYIQGQNLFTLTGYTGADPAISNVNQGSGGQTTAGGVNDIWTGFDHGVYPASRIIMFGVNATF